MSDTECDWFDKNDDELMKDVQKTAKAKQAESNEEHIKGPAETLDDYIKQLTLKASSHSKNDAGGSKKINITELRKIFAMSPLDMFLHVQTLEYNFYSGQIQPNDSQERVILYINVLASICRLELPGFHKFVLDSFKKNLCLLDRIRLLTAKWLCKRFKDMWKDMEDMQHLLANVKLLVIQSISADDMDEGQLTFLKDMLKIIEKGDNDMDVCKRFSQDLQESIQQVLNKQEIGKSPILEIYPSLDDILTKKIVDFQQLPSDGSITVQDYILHHMHFLKQDFLLPLRDCVDAVRYSKVNQQLPDNFHVYNNTLIVLNEQFLDANRHELIFADVLGPRRKQDDEQPQVSWGMQEKLLKIKSGALLCFTTSKEFDNLILATVTYTSQECLKEGYIGIEIARQYNIGNIYNRPLIMFESPIFFEPYHNVFNYFKNCSITEFPMQKYIIKEDLSSVTSAYVKEKTAYDCYGEKFHPIKDLPPNQNLKLNPSQLQAFSEALKREFALIQGPPGTGKTHLSVQIVKTLIENADTPIILITYTNESLDKFLLKLSEHCENIVRFGSQTRDPRISKYNIKDVVEHSLINPKLKKVYFLTSLEFKDCFQKLQHQHREFDGTDETYSEILKAQLKLFEVSEKLRTLKTLFQYYAAGEKAIVAMTTTCAARTNFLFRLLKSKIVIFEEAAEILESHVVACLTPYTQHVIMIGDHQQLQPYTSNHQLQLNCPMNISLFERLFNKQLNPIALRTQYRMQPKIAELLCNTIYKNLESDASVFQYPAIRQMSKNLFFMTHQKPEAKIEQDSSVYNPYEITQVIQLALHLVQNALYDTQDIHILSPYAKQVDMIKKQLQQQPALQSLKASTVDSFQGLECNIIILSLVRSNNSNQIGFLKQSNRICVALSRAKHGMFIIGNLQMFSNCSDIWKEIEQKLLQNNAVGDKFPIESENYYYDK